MLSLFKIFKVKKFTQNEAIQMMHENTSQSFLEVANYAKNNRLSASEIIEILIEASEQMDAQAKVVGLREELNIDSSYNKN